MSGKSGSMRHLWRSVGFRLAFYYGLLVSITMLATVSIIYVRTVGVLYQGMSQQVKALSQKLTVEYERGGPQALAQEIERSLSDEQDVATELFLYLDPYGRKLAGNLDTPPSKVVGFGSGYHQPILRGGVELLAYVVLKVMPDGSQLFVGNDLRDQKAIDELVTSGITVACAVAVLLLLGGLFVFHQELNRSVEAIRRTLNRVATGEMKERVEPLGQDDEFALLGNDINKMLDHIEVLMSGVRHVSDTIAHNLRTPLTRILWRLRNAAEQAGISDAQKSNIEAAVRDSEELISVFEKLLQIAEAEAGTRRIHFQAVSLSSVVSEVLDFYEAVAEIQGGKLVWVGTEDGIVMGDPDLLAGAIANLVDNALKYGGTGVTVTVRSETSRDHILLRVQDDGPGIAVQALQQLGTRFFRVDRTISGHGLGVASVVAVVALHAGRIWFESAQPGLVVTMELPRHTHLHLHDE